MSSLSGRRISGAFTYSFAHDGHLVATNVTSRPAMSRPYSSVGSTVDPQATHAFSPFARETAALDGIV